MHALDTARLQQALALAESVMGQTEPNPRVGCVLGLEDGTVLGQGATQPAGGAHAEVMALRDAAAAGASVRGASAWVTLEPCAHHGRTPPCCDALIEAGLARVVVALADPFAAVNGAGIARLRAAGVQVEMASDAIAHAAWEINPGFFSRVQRGRPWVRVKAAASLDGRTALNNGASQWITSAAARRDGHLWRRRAGAVLSGIGTVLADDPRLDVRLPPAADGRAPPVVPQPLRVIVDSQGRIPAQARLLAAPGQVLIVTAHAGGPASGPASAWPHGPWPESAPDAGSNQRLQGLNLPGPGAGPDGPAGRVDLGALMQVLAARGVNELHVEAGATLNGALARAGLVDEWLIYLAPVFLGPGREIVALAPLTSLDQAQRLQLVDAQPIGPDLRLRLRPENVDAPYTRLTLD